MKSVERNSPMRSNDQPCSEFRVGRFFSVRVINVFVVFCVIAMLTPVAALADDATLKSFEITEDETQLAQRFALRERAESPFEYSLNASYRQDNLNWSISGAGANVASAVSWNKIIIAQLRATAKINLNSNWLVRAVYTSGAVKSGDSRDSDYAGNNRTQEFSRSDNQTGGSVRDLSIGLGRKFCLFDFPSGWEMYVSPVAGMSVHQQNLTMTDGRQTIPSSGAITGLNNSYDTQWKGTWLGMDALLGFGESFSLNSTAEYHKVDYTADANWNLRSEFAHPTSFKHVAQGNGVLVSVGISYRVSRNFLLNTTFEQQNWSTYAGYDQTNFSYGTTSFYTLNQVNWDSSSYSLGAAYQF